VGLLEVSASDMLKSPSLGVVKTRVGVMLKEKVQNDQSGKSQDFTGDNSIEGGGELVHLEIKFKRSML